MERVHSFQEFLERSKGFPALLFVKEKNCPYCKAAEEVLGGTFYPDSENLRLFEALIDDSPRLTVDLGLTGVPAFVLKNSKGRIKIKVGLCKAIELQEFIAGAL